MFGSEALKTPTGQNVKFTRGGGGAIMGLYFRAEHFRAEQYGGGVVCLPPIRTPTMKYKNTIRTRKTVISREGRYGLFRVQNSERSKRP